MTTGFPVRGRVRHYQWGGKEFIPRLLGAEPDGEPWAEYWLGAHPQDPAEVLMDGRWQPLDQLIAAEPEKWLGQGTSQTFGQLPYLMKILDVAQPLSIQVHPNPRQAKDGFAAENTAAIALDDRRRNFKDDNHKPELALALSDFWLLYGLRSEQEMVETLSRYPTLQELADTAASSGPEQLLAKIFLADQTTLQRWIKPLFPAAAGETDKTLPAYWISAWRQLHSSDDDAVDPGVLGFLVMNLRKLEYGQTIYQEAGVPHAYLRGQCLEIMANSDNVLRAGLTPKHVDPQLLLSHLDFERCAIQAEAPPSSLKEFTLQQLPEGAELATPPAAAMVLHLAPHPELPAPFLTLKQAQFFGGHGKGHVSCCHGEMTLIGSPNIS